MDTASVIAGMAGGNASMRIGTVTGYDTGSITVDVGGGSLLTAFYLSTYLPAVGDQVVIVSTGKTWVVLGAIGNTQSRLIPVTAAVDTLQSTSTTGSYVDLATPGPSVTATIGAAGKALVTITAFLSRSTAGQASMCYQVSGATSVAPTTARAVTMNTHNSLGFDLQASASFLVTGLNPGDHTFTAKYFNVPSGSASFADRVISVVPY